MNIPNVYKAAYLLHIGLYNLNAFPNFQIFPFYVGLYDTIDEELMRSCPLKIFFKMLFLLNNWWIYWAHSG